MSKKVIFCDSREAVLEHLKKNKKNKSVLKTNAPSLNLNLIDRLETIHLDKETDDLIPKLISKIIPVTKAIYKECISNGFSENFSSLAAMHGYKLFNIIKQLAVIEESDLKDSSVVIDLKVQNQTFDNFYNEIIKKEENKLQYISLVKKKLLTPNRFEVLKVSNFERKEYFFWKKIWKFLPNKFSKGTFLINRESDLLNETYIHLARKGYSMKKVHSPEISSSYHSLKMENFYIYKLKPIIKKIILFFLSGKKCNIAEMIFKKRILKDFMIFEQSQLFWISKLEYFKDIKTLGLLDSFVVGPIWNALSEVLRKNKITVSSFQHGHSKEFCDLQKFAISFGEIVTADLFFCYSDITKDFAKKIPFPKSKIHVVGVPKLYTHNHSYKKKDLKNTDILYISTCVHSSHRQPIVTNNWSDKKKTLNELFIIKNILSKISHSCLFKTYPVKVYSDNDEIENSVKKYKNISYFDSEYDLTFLKNHAKVIITSRATSTLGWCMGLSKPLVFINYKSNYSVTKNFKRDAPKAIFYFEAEEKNFLKNIVNFLSQPIEKIEEEWCQKKEFRNKLWFKFFSKELKNNFAAGKEAANIILKTL